MSLVKSTATIGFYTMISRVLGFARDVTIASSLGAGMLSDAFFVAFKLPNFLRRLFAEGAFNAAFVPMFSGKLAVDGEEDARKFSSEAMSYLLLVLLIVTGLCMVAMPWLMYVLAPGFSDNPEKFELTVLLTRITMPYIIFISLVSLLGGILNSGGKFAAVAATPIIMNLCLIIIPHFIYHDLPSYAHALSVAVMASGVAQWLWLVHFCKKRGVLPKLVRPHLSPDVKKLLKLIAPAALGAGVAQVNLFIDIIIASKFDSGVSYLYYADRINELPLAIIGIAVGTALLPMLSRQIREGDHAGAVKSQTRAIELALFLSLPAAVALITIAEPIISAVYQRHAFGIPETIATYKTLIAFALGLPAFVLVKILAPGFYAHQDTKTPFKIATVCVFINLFFNLALMIPLQYVGMALATTIAGWANVAMMVTVLKKRGWLEVERDLVVQGIKIIAACAVMALILYRIAIYDAWALTSGGDLIKFLAITVVIMAGAGAYFSACLLMNTMAIRSRLVLWMEKKYE